MNLVIYFDGGCYHNPGNEERPINPPVPGLFEFIHQFSRELDVYIYSPSFAIEEARIAAETWLAAWYVLSSSYNNFHLPARLTETMPDYFILFRKIENYDTISGGWGVS